MRYWREVADRPLALPQKGKLETACDRANYLDERRAMMQRSPDYVDYLVVEALRPA